MRWTRARTIAALLAVVAVGFYAWAGAEQKAAQREVDACIANAPGIPLGSFGCGFIAIAAGILQATIAFTLLVAAALLLAFERWRRWRAERPQREARALEREIAAIDAELAAIDAGLGKGHLGTGGPGKGR